MVWRKQEILEDLTLYKKRFDGKYQSTTVDLYVVELYSWTVKGKKVVGYRAYFAQTPYWLQSFQEPVIGKTKKDVVKRAKKMVETYWKMYNTKW